MLKRLGHAVLGATGAAVAVNTDITKPAYLLTPAANAAAAGFSIASLAAFAPARRRSWLVVVPHGANLALQILQSGRWAVAPAIADPDKPRTRVVVLGSGWGASSFLKSLDKQLTGEGGWYDVVVVSPNNFFQYTPLLPGAVTGSVDVRSIIESTRQLLQGRGTYLQAECLDVDPRTKTLHCKYNKPSRGSPREHEFELPYDILVCAVGAISNTFNTPGVQDHAFFLKEARDAESLRSRINECFELASLPGTSKAGRREILTFCVVGGGPTGVEIAAEMHDLFEEDLLPRFPHLRGDVHVKLIETRDHVLSSFDRQISTYADAEFARQGIEVVYNSRVNAVENDGVVLSMKGHDGPVKLIAGTTVWCTGIKMNPVVARIIKAMPEGQQEHSKAVDVDHHLSVRGSGGSIFAIGDAATIGQERALDHAEELFEQADTNKDGVLSAHEVRGLIRTAKERYPHLAEHALQFHCGDADGLVEELQDFMEDTSSYLPTWMQMGKRKERIAAESATAVAAVADRAGGVESRGNEDKGIISQQEFRARLEAIDKKLRTLPATAQVAAQQGKYLGAMFNNFRIPPVPSLDPTRHGLPSSSKRFQYKHLGTFAYVGGDHAVLELPTNSEDHNVLTGMMAGLLWKSAETFMQISLKNKWMVSRDWLKVKMFGRDISDA